MSLFKDFKESIVGFMDEIRCDEPLDAELVVMIYERKSAIQTGRRGAKEKAAEQVLPGPQPFACFTILKPHSAATSRRWTKPMASVVNAAVYAAAERRKGARSSSIMGLLARIPMQSSE